MTVTTDFLNHLNCEQRQAVEHFCGPLLVVAGAGSGKTRALTYRIANLILKHGIDPDNILAVTFTNKAAKEMKERIKKLLTEESKGFRNLPSWIGTFHSLCGRILRYDIDKYQDDQGRKWNKNFSIFDEDDVQKMIKEIIIKQLNLDDKKFEPRSIRSAISNAKNQGFLPRDIEIDQPTYRGKTIAQIYRIYQDKLAENNALDFDDLILIPVRLFQQNPTVLNYWHGRFHHILTDEYQDTNRIQYELIRLLTTNGENKKSKWDWRDRSIFVVGDVDQCQPPGSKVLTTEGYISIEDLVPQKHWLVSYNRMNGEITSRAGGLKFGKATRSFTGKLVVVKAGGKKVKCTPNHRWPIKWNKTAKQKSHVVYLMQQGDLYRIGSCKLFASDTKIELWHQFKAQKADAVWILTTEENASTASLKEAAIASKYDISTDNFESITQNTNEDFAEWLKECFIDHKRQPEYPIYTSELASKRRGDLDIIDIEAINLLPGLMTIGFDRGAKEVSWEQLTIQYEEYSGLVYSLNVEKYQVYFTDSLLTHNSIYSFRGADYTVLLEFQEDFGDGLPDETTRTMIKLEDNYRSKENILEAANQLIQNNTQRIDKVLKATRGAGEKIYCHKADNELEEAAFVINKIRSMQRQNPELNWGSFAILYRMNAQSRPLEESLVKWNIPYVMVGGFKFYDRKEIKDCLAYLRLIVNPSDSMSLKRVINTPKRGIGDTTIDRLEATAQELGVPIWEIISEETSVNTLGGRAAKNIWDFVKVILTAQAQLETTPPSEILKQVMADSGYMQDLKNQGTDEADNRLENIKELYNAMLQFQEEHEEATLENFLAKASLASDLDNLEEGEKAVSMMTLHSAKGLEFPIVFLVGLEQGLLPHSRSLQDSVGLEEERRLCYVGITRAQEQLFITHTSERRLWGYREPAIESQFLRELPKDLLDQGGLKSSFSDIETSSTRVILPKSSASKSVKSKTAKINQLDWQVGDRILHGSFGIGQVTHLLGAGNKMTLAIKFPGAGQKIIDPRIAPLQKLD